MLRPRPGRVVALPCSQVRNLGSLIDPITSRTKRGVVEGLAFVPDFSHRSGSSITVTFANHTIGKQGLNPGIAVGDAFILGERTGPPGFSVLGGEDVTFLGVTAYACANECFTSAYTSKLNILSTSMILLPGRFKSGNDGGHNHHSARIGAWIEGGAWQNTGDDICHVSSLVMSATQQWTDPTSGSPMLRLQASTGDRYMRDHGGGRLTNIHVGDTLQFFNRSAGVLLSERTVVSVSFDSPDPRAGKHQGGVTVVALDGPPGKLDLGVIGSITAATNVFDLNATQTQFVFRKNSVLNGRRFGVLAKGLRLVVEDNSFTGLGSGAVQFLNSVTEGLCARSAVVRRNTVTDVCQLANHGSAPNFDPNAAFWTNIQPRQTGAGAAAGIPCHQDLLFSDNSVASGPHSVVQLYASSNVRIERTVATRCGDSPWTAWALPGDDSSIVVAGDNVVANSTEPRFCAKRASLVKSEGDASVYFVDYFVQTGGGMAASPVLHKLGSCHRCGDEHLCERMGIEMVEADFITGRTLGAAFDCTMLPGPRVLRCSACSGPAVMVFQPHPSAVGQNTVHAISSCGDCGGDLCSVIVDVDPEYWSTLVQNATQPFECWMAMGSERPV